MQSACHRQLPLSGLSVCRPSPILPMLPPSLAVDLGSAPTSQQRLVFGPQEGHRSRGDGPQVTRTSEHSCGNTRTPPPRARKKWWSKDGRKSSSPKANHPPHVAEASRNSPPPTSNWPGGHFKQTLSLRSGFTKCSSGPQWTEHGSETQQGQGQGQSGQCWHPAVAFPAEIPSKPRRNSRSGQPRGWRS